MYLYVLKHVYFVCMCFAIYVYIEKGSHKFGTDQGAVYESFRRRKGKIM